MQDSGIPAKFNIPFANGAGGAYIRTIPQASQIGVQNGAASLTDGFPPNCFIPIAGGGSWPFAQDFNGVLNQITAWDRWVQAGGPITYDSTFQTAIGGYPKSAVVMSAVTAGLYWRSTAENNTTNPDSGGAGWVSALAGRLLNIQVFTASGTYTPTTGTRSIDVEVCGGGGAGGGVVTTSGGQMGGGSGGGGGGYARKFIGGITGSFAVTIGAGGTPVVAGNGNAGGTTSFGSAVSATAGSGGSVGPAQSNTTTVGPYGNGTPGTGVGGDVNEVGGVGFYAFYAYSFNPISGVGGSSHFGPGATWATGLSAGTSATNRGAGGSGGVLNTGYPGGTSGGYGMAGLCVVREYS